VKDYRELRKNLKKDYGAFPKVKIALLSTQAAQYPAQALRAAAYEYRLDADIYEAPFDRIEEETRDTASGLYAFEPDIAVILPVAENVRGRYYSLAPDARGSFTEAEANRLLDAAGRVSRQSGAHVVICSLAEIDDGIYGSYAASYPLSLLSVTRAVNNRIAEGAAATPGIGLADIAALASRYGTADAGDGRMYYLSSSAFSQQFLFAAMDRVMSYIAALRGRVRKCLVTDLDGTLWGGVVGDIGMESIEVGEMGMGRAYSDLQAWIKELSRRGIAVCVCSKNDEKIAKEPFLSHPGMKLSLDDIAVFKANWQDKSQNLREIKEALNIGYDSMVFIDDNPVERGAVRSQLPDVEVPELPADASGFLAFLQAENLFETVALSDEDAMRTEMYRAAGEREAAKDSAGSLEEYLQSLGMVCKISPFDSYSIPRVAQLTQRTNQFNLRTVRYAESDIEKAAADASSITMAVSLTDAYGDYGIIGAVIMKETEKGGLFLDTWLMSCRAVKRGVEEFVFNRMAQAAAEQGYSVIEAEYAPTEKNAPVKGLLANMGFTEGAAGRWVLNIGEYAPKRTYIAEG
jgi:FkbH-like protein